MEIVDLRELALKKVKITGNVIGKFGTFEIEQMYKNNTKDVLEPIRVFRVTPQNFTPTQLTGLCSAFRIKQVYGNEQNEKKARHRFHTQEEQGIYREEGLSRDQIRDLFHRRGGQYVREGIHILQRERYRREDSQPYSPLH